MRQPSDDAADVPVVPAADQAPAESPQYLPLAAGATDQVPDIVALANRDEIDECDVVCDAFPALACNDLSQVEASWLADHVAECGYCRREMSRYQRVCSCLDQVYAADDALPCPAPRLVALRPTAWYDVLTSPVGPLFVATTDRALVAVEFADGRTEAALQHDLRARGYSPRPRSEGDLGNAALFARVEGQLTEYFAGERRAFDLPLDLSGVPDFTRQVLTATAEVPFGGKETYLGIATRVGKPGATRAVGNALNRNPVPVVVPCHRIIRTDGSLGGYAGGPDLKRRLLQLEGGILSAVTG